MNFQCSKVAMILNTQKLKVTPNVKEPHKPQHFLGTDFSRRPFSKNYEKQILQGTLWLSRIINNLLCFSFPYSQFSPCYPRNQTEYTKEKF